MRRLLLFAASSLLVLVPACGNEGTGPTGDGKTLLVGVIFPMTGNHATYGEESWNGMLLAEEDVRKAGEPLPFRLLLKDEKSSKTEAANQAKSLIDNDGVHVILGSVASSITMQIGQEAKEAGVPLITPASTNDDVTIQGGEWVSRICFKDSFQADVLARFALQKGWKKAALVVDKANAYSTGLAKNFERSFTTGGGTVSNDFFTEGDSDLSNVIENVAGRGPEVIFISGYYSDAGPMIRQAKGKWDGIPILGGDGLDSPDLLKLIGDTNAEIYFSTHFAADGPDPEVQAFASRYRAKYGELPGAMAALGYDVLMVLMDAVRRAKDPRDRRELAKAIRETKGVKGITGMIDLTTPDRTPIKDLVFVKVNGAFKYHATVGAAK
jgi:branched-chain amino acid transport system substrate-binding protein